MAVGSIVFAGLTLLMVVSFMTVRRRNRRYQENEEEK